MDRAIQERGIGSTGEVSSTAVIDKEEGINISKMLDHKENALRSLLLDELVRLQKPLLPEEIKRAGRKFRFAVDEVLRRLEGKGVIVRGEDHAVVAVYPVSAAPTRHQVRLSDGRTFYAMCAIDAIGSAFVFKQDTTVESTCLYCNSSVRFCLADNKLQGVENGTVYVLHADLAKYHNWAADC